MSIDSWILDLYARESNDGARLTAGRSRKGDDKPLTLTLNNRTVYFIQRFLEHCVEAEGVYIAKREMFRALEDLERALEEAKKREERERFLRKTLSKRSLESVADEP